MQTFLYLCISPAYKVLLRGIYWLMAPDIVLSQLGQFSTEFVKLNPPEITHTQNRSNSAMNQSEFGGNA